MTNLLITLAVGAAALVLAFCLGKVKHREKIAQRRSEAAKKALEAAVNAPGNEDVRDRLDRGDF
jgi:hypothetical protein